MDQIKQLLLDGNNIAFNPLLGNSYQLNEIGVTILNLLKKDMDKEDIVKQLSQDYEASENEIYIDVTDFISKLKVYGLLA